MKKVRQVWAESQQILALVNAGEEDKIDRSDPWIRHMTRIARLSPELGQELDQLKANFSQCRFVAYGRTRIDQRRRLDEVRAQLAPRPFRPPLRSGPSLVGALGVRLSPELQDALRGVPPKMVDELVQAVLDAPKKSAA